MGAAMEMVKIADIIDVLRADHRHIMIWRAELGELGRQGSGPGRRQGLASTWDTLASLIGLHMTAEEEILGLPMREAGTWELAQAREVLGAQEDIREVIGETSLQLPGSPLWWHLARSALSAWAVAVDRQEHRILPDFAGRTSPAEREGLCRQWRAFMEARIRDQIPDAPPQAATCELRRARPSPSVPRVASIAFDPIYCTCPDCDNALDQMFPALSPRPRRAPPPLASSGASGGLAFPAAPGPAVVRVCEQVIANLIGDGYADMANIQLPGPAGGALRIIAQDGFGSEFLEFFEIVRGAESACGAALVRTRPVWVPDVALSPIFAGTPAGDIVLGADVRSVASVPVLADDGNLIAMISAHRREPGPWTELQRRHLEGVATQTGQLLAKVS